MNGGEGTVAVTLSDYNPEYHGWTWVRDGALVMKVIENEFGSATGAKRHSLLQRLGEYIDFSKRAQDAVGLGNLGEPRFDFEGKPYSGPWGRPQNDGPALRVITLSALAGRLAQSADPKERALAAQLYTVQPHDKCLCLIKRDLEYIVNHYKEKSFDLWEEKRGLHFFTLMAQRAALLDGAALARKMSDPFAAEYYADVAKDIGRMLEGFWEKDRGFIGAARDLEPWRHNDASNLDIAVILGVIHASRVGQSFGVMDSRSLATALRIEETFRTLYEINKTSADAAGNPLAPAIGRYPEDVYNGHPDERQRFTEGHPWVLATHAMAVFYFRASIALARGGTLRVDETNRPALQALLGPSVTLQNEGLPANHPYRARLARAAYEKGRAFMARVRHHLPGDDPYSEMINARTGRPQSIPSLAWSDASSVEAQDAQAVASSVLGLE